MKKCTVCGEWKVASTYNFYKHKGGRYGLASECKKCKSKYFKQWRLENKEKMVEYSKKWYEANKERKAKYDKQYRENNKEKIAERDKQYREINKERRAEQSKRWREANPEYYKQYYESPKGQVVRFNSCQRRRIKEEQQGTGITKDQWLECMSFFGWQCAYSGEVLSKDTRSIDHIVPIDAGGDNMVWNMVPMTRSLNSSKCDKDMLEWYKEQDFYDPKRLDKIYQWQEYAYNKYGKDTDYFNTNDTQIKLI